MTMFKNAKFFRVTHHDFTDEQLQEALGKDSFIPCTKHEKKRIGWVSPFGKSSDYLAPSVAGCYKVALKIEVRKVPKDAIEDVLSSKIAELKQSNPEAVFGQKQIRTMKEEIERDLQPQAFSKIDVINGYIDTQNNLIVVDAGSDNKSESLLSALKLSLKPEALKTVPLRTVLDPAARMTDWILNDALPEDLTDERCATLRDHYSEGKGTIKYKDQDVSDEKVKEYLKSGMAVADLKLSHSGGTEFTLHESLSLKGLSFVVDDSEIDEETAEAETMAYFSVMVEEIRTIADYLVNEALGGEYKVGEE